MSEQLDINWPNAINQLPAEVRSAVMRRFDEERNRSDPRGLGIEMRAALVKFWLLNPVTDELTPFARQLCLRMKDSK